MTNFRLAEERARRISRFLIAIYIGAVAVMSIATLPLVLILSTIIAGVGILFSKDGGVTAMNDFFGLAWKGGTWIVTTENGHIVALVAMASATLVILTASLERIYALRAGGSAVAESVGARRIAGNTADLDERRVLNVVEEMAIASALPVPPVYVLPRTPGINAFAAGHTASDAVVAVTEGCVHRLSRDQLQGVVAHEFGHIRSGDMRLNVRLIGLLHGIVVVSETGKVLVNLDCNRNPLVIPGLAMIIVGGGGSLLGSVIRGAVNRGREYLADACAVEFTRYPDGLAGALKVVGGEGGEVETRGAQQCGHMFFVSGLSGWGSRLVATHPPLEERIKRLDPAWNGAWLAGRAMPEPEEPVHRVPLQRVAAAMPLAGAAVFADGLGPEEVARRVQGARDQIDSLDPALRVAARNACDARLLVCAMLLDRRDGVAARQREMIAARLGAAEAAEAARLKGILADAPAGSRLALVEISLGSLAALSTEQFEAFRAVVDEMVRADDRVSLFEWCLQRLLVTHLERRHVNARPRATQYYNLKGLVPQCSVLLSAAAHAGGAGESAGRALERAGRSLEIEGVRLMRPEECVPEVLGEAMDRLGQAHLRVRRSFVMACAEVVGSDGKLEGAEAELLRTIADGLDVPLVVEGAGKGH